MKLLVINNGTSYLKPLLKALSPNDVTVITREEFLKIKKLSCDVVILSGGHSLTVKNHDQEYMNELSLIKKGNRPVLGICLGFELVAHAFGATLIKLKAKENNIVKMTAAFPHPIFSGLKNITAFENHRWVVKKAKKPLICLASSKDGCEIIAHQSKLIFGLQFHPEMLPNKTSGGLILKNCLKYIKKNLKCKTASV